MPLGNTIMEWSIDYDPATPEAATWVKLSDHNREAVGVDFTRIETKQRMVTGTMRKYVVAKKRTWSTSWDMLPSHNDITNFPGTVDGGMSGSELESYQDTENGSFYMRMKSGDGTVTTGPVEVMISEFSKSVVKRSPTGDGTKSLEFWDVSLSVEEV